MLFRLIKAQKRKGQSLVEYALLLVLIAVVSIGMLRGFGRQVDTTYSKVEESLVGACPAGGC